MLNFHVNFAHPWLWLLLIPAVACALIPYFRIPKKYRRTRNRIISLCLHLMVVCLCAATLVNTTFDYEMYNPENEILLVIDSSYSTEQEKTAKENYVRDFVAMADTRVYKVGIVTFGADQKYVVPFTNDTSSVYERYVSSEAPDTSATDIAAALTYAKTLFSKPDTGKIVLISDGFETDDNAAAVISSLTKTSEGLNGLRIDTITSSAYAPDNDVQLNAIVTPDYNVNVDEKFNLGFTVKNVGEKISANVVLYDNGEEKSRTAVEIAKGEQTLYVEHSYAEKGLHSLKATIEIDNDGIIENNTVYTYDYVESFSDILVIQGFEGESEEIKALLSEYEVTVLTIGADEMPKNIEELRGFDEIILNNVSNADLKRYEGFDKLLNEYVSVVGGGLFTVGGNEKTDAKTAHAYNREDMQGSLYQQMLPMQVIDYTPPLGLFIIIDVSGSMGTGEGSKLEAAKDTARSIVSDPNVVSDRDYCGVITLSDDADRVLRLTPLTKQSEILDAIYNIETGNSTNFAPSLTAASRSLINAYNGGEVERMHVIVISDGEAADYDEYLAVVKKYAKTDTSASEDAPGDGEVIPESAKISFSFVGVEIKDNYLQKLQAAAAAGNGGAYNCTASNLTSSIKQDIGLHAVAESREVSFIPQIKSDSYYAGVISQSQMPALKGFYGTKAREGTTVLSGEYGVPIYSEWKYGAGTVGSFMCDLNNVWSSDFLSNEYGQKLLLAIINKIFPTENVKPKKINIVLREENYTTQAGVTYADALKDGETAKIEVVNVDDAEVKAEVSDLSSRYSRATIKITTPGVYAVTVTRFSSDGTEVATRTVYKSFSYSKEYVYPDEKFDNVGYMQRLAKGDEEKNIPASSQLLSDVDPYLAFAGFNRTNKFSYDPRILMMILVLVLFLLDIAVRKFKFKWIHELVRERKEKRAAKTTNGGRV